jgi:hypothetical protein
MSGMPRQIRLIASDVTIVLSQIINNLTDDKNLHFL